MATLLLSGISFPVAMASTASATSTTVYKNGPVTFTGTASGFLAGPLLVGNPFGVTGGPTGHVVSPFIEDLNPKPYVQDPPPTATIPPTVTCNTSGCFTISSTSAATTNPTAMSAVDSTPFTVEPPDQGLCAGAGYAMETINQGEVQIFNSTTLAPMSSSVSLDTIMGLTALGWSSGGDIMCQYDSANGGHWFITQFVSGTPEAAGGPFGGCFIGVPFTCYEGIAVSKTSNPMGNYNVYFLNVNQVNNDPGVGQLLNDYAKTALTRDAFLLFYNEYSLVTGALNGAQEFAFSKSALEHGSTTVNVAYENMGTAPNLTPIPANGVYQPFDLPGSAWYSVIPAQTTDPSQYDNANGGTGFMMSSLDFFGAGDNRVAVFDWTGLSALNSPGCSSCGSIAFGGALLTGTVTYQDEGAPCFVSQYLTVSTFCGLGAQKAGPTPLGDNCALLGDGETNPCPESGIMSNGDGATNAFFSGGMLWTAVSTIVNETFGHSPSELHLGATYWGVSTTNLANHVKFNLPNQGYVSARHEDLEFPTMAASGSSVLMSFTLNGNGGPTGADNGGLYPSSAYFMVSAGGSIHITAMGKAPQDGFTEYQFYGTVNADFFRPRWGDYGQAVFNPSAGKFFFSSEFVPFKACSDSAFLSDLTCGGTRAPAANFGTTINSLSP